MPDADKSVSALATNRHVLDKSARWSLGITLLLHCFAGCVVIQKLTVRTRKFVLWTVVDVFALKHEWWSDRCRQNVSCPSVVKLDRPDHLISCETYTLTTTATAVHRNAIPATGAVGHYIRQLFDALGRILFIILSCALVWDMRCLQNFLRNTSGRKHSCKVLGTRYGVW